MYQSSIVSGTGRPAIAGHILWYHGRVILNVRCRANTLSSPVEIVQRFYNALGRGDTEGVLAALDEEVEWTEAERFPYYAGTWHGPQEVFENLFLRLANDWDGFAAIPAEYIADGDRVVALGTYTGTYKDTGRGIAVPYAHVWTVRGNRLLKFVQYTDTAKVLEAIR
jgi:uncharacterized protein